MTKPVAGGQYINFVRAGSSVYSLGYLPNSNIFGFGVGAATDASFNPSLRLVNNSAVAITGQTWASFEVAGAENGCWFGTTTPNVTYHSVAGDAVINNISTTGIVTPRQSGGQTTFESALTINFTNQTGFNPAGGGNNNGKAGFLNSGAGNPGGACMWLQANDLIVNTG